MENPPGGVFINVDPDSFETSGECYVEKPSVACLGQFHPDTGARLSGIKIPYSDEIETMIDKAANVFSEHSYLGWDVAITAGGPCLIEVNLGFDIDHHQTAAECAQPSADSTDRQAPKLFPN